MPDRISGLRIGRSYQVIVGDGSDTSELLFRLGEKEGLELVKVYGQPTMLVASAPATFDVRPRSQQTLHFRTGTLEDTQFDQTTDAQQVDSEIVFQQTLQGMSFDGTTEAAAALMVNPSQAIDYLDDRGRGLFTARNPTHRVEGAIATWSIQWTLIFHYYFVQFDDSELGILFGRRS